MDNVNPDTVSEISVVFVGEESEFMTERSVINDLIYPILRRYFMDEFQLEFNVVDVFHEANCKSLPSIDRSELILSQLRRSQKMSNGFSSLIILGDQYGKLNAPKDLTSSQFNHVLNYLQMKKDPMWKTFISLYTKSKSSDEYILNENISEEDSYLILSLIESSLPSSENIFPEKFKMDYYTSLLEKCLALVSTDRSTISSTQIIRRITSNSNTSSDSKSIPDTLFQKALKDKYEALIKATKKKFLPNNFTEYSVNNLLLLGATRDIRQNREKLVQIGELSNIISGKSRSLSKDLRVSATSDTYLQIFLEHVGRIIRENCLNFLQLRKEDFKDVLNAESKSHVLENKKIENEELRTILYKDREREKNIFQGYINSSSATMPGLLFGPTGSGKTTLLLDLAESLSQTSTMISVIRHCGRTVSSCSLQLLISSISHQINAILSKKPIVNNACEYAQCVYDFWMSLVKVGSSKSIVILLDDVENLFPSSHTDMMKWLPPTLPTGVKVILTSSSESFYLGFKKRYEVSNIINLTKTDPKECIKLFPSLLDGPQRSTISELVFNQANFCLQENSTPLFMLLLSKFLERVKEPDQLNSDTKTLFKIFLGRLESLSNPIILKHVVSYIALSRFGLSVSELTDILTLDNKILELLEFKIQGKVIFKFPIYLTLYYLNLCNDILISVPTSGKKLFRLKHQVFLASTIEYYSLTQDDGKFFFQTLYDYWTSRFSGDKLKPVFDISSEDVDDQFVSENHLYVKRAILPQPYFTTYKDRRMISNERKLLELPHLLIKFEKTSELYRLVVFNFEYLFATLHCFGINQLISELYFTRQLNEIKNNTELELLLVQLRLLTPEVFKDARLLGPELSGRLCHLIGSNALLSQLHHQMDTIGTKVNVLLAAIPCYPTIDVENMKIEIGSGLDLLFSALSPDNRFISTLIRDNMTKEFLIIIWDSRSATKSQIINIGKLANTKFSTIFYMPQSDEYVMLQYEDTVGTGFFIVNLEFSLIESSIKFPKNCSIKIDHVSKSHLYLNINGETEVYTHPSGQKDFALSKHLWPTQMTPNDRYLIGPKPVSKKPPEGNRNTFNLKVMNAATGEVLCQLYLNITTSCMLANVRNETLFVGTKNHGIIFRFDIGLIAKKDVKSLKNSLELKLGVQPSLSEDMNNHILKFSPAIRVNKLQLSLEERFLMAEYVFNDSLRSFGVWNISNKSLILGHMLEPTTTVTFSTDGQYVCYFQRSGTLNLFNLSNGTEHRLLLKDIPDQVFPLKAGSFFISFKKSVKLATLKFLMYDCGDLSTPRTFLQENFYTSLLKPKVSRENIVLYSNNEETSKFFYLKLNTNSIATMDISHTNESLTKYSTDRFLSPDGQKLLLVFGFKLASLMVTDQELDIDSLSIPLQSNGRLISNLNDYRKPQIPKENYFTGKSSNSAKSSQNRAAYEQMIIKIIDLQSSKVFFQVSLTGEQILQFTDTLLLTFRPDYASLTRSSENAFDIVSIYDVMKARFISSLYLEHPVVDSVLLSKEKDKLLVCCGYGGSILKLLGGEYFSTVLYEMNVQSMLRYYDEFARSSYVTKMFTFTDNSEGLLLEYSWLDSGGSVKVEKDTYYASIDTVKKEIICQFSSLGRITDVSSDGSTAIDSMLNIYDLSKGSIIRKLYTSIGRKDESVHFSCVNLFSRDLNHIVTVDSDSKCIWVIRNDEQGLVIGKALLSSSVGDDASLSHFKMELAMDGHLVVVYNDRHFKVFVVKTAQKASSYELNYKSSIERLKKILLPGN